MLSPTRSLILVVLASTPTPSSPPRPVAGVRLPLEPAVPPRSADFDVETEAEIWFTPRPGPVDTSPSPFACTAQTLLMDQPCVFESQAPASRAVAQPAEINRNEGLTLGLALCVQQTANTPDETLRAHQRGFCQRRMERGLDACGSEGSHPLTDAGGRFMPQSRDCYAAIRDVLHQARTLDGAQGECCQCLAAPGCGTSFDECAEHLVDGVRPDDAGQCLSRACAEPCHAASLLGDALPAPKPSAPVRPSTKPAVSL